LILTVGCQFIRTNNFQKLKISNPHKDTQITDCQHNQQKVRLTFNNSQLMR